VPVKANVRIITATHQNLEKRVELGEFREDLFHRLNVIRIQLPALNERKEDIAALAKHFLTKAAKELAVAPKALSPDVEQYLMELNWPGNVRQLENVCRWLTVMSPSQIVQRDDLPSDIAQGDITGDNGVADWQTLFKQWAAKKALSGEGGALANIVSEVEALLMQVALERTAGKRQEAAKLLGWGRNTLTRKLKDS
jgi:two-component system nitrogen regulation response regulator GlnG